ncbi:polysaccharide export protein [Spirosoma sp. HMF4905]|uniref:Polysaccharide export protein n=1 Tax=Spirosoma arboris TaxID=2682092 RepID=A0A7K1SA73_9BACT|nr:polysaccharide biosynthesis/export family protein [Spirosoma arboris]MVM30436.1 polysaccharide export protein [Spirosoma arboris]
MNSLSTDKLKRKGSILISFAAIILWIASLTGCTSAKKLVYFQGATSRDDTVMMPEPFVPIIKKGDVLSVQVSSLNAEASAYFNPPAATENTPSITIANPLARTTGYLVDTDGTIKLPLIGQVTVADLTNAKAGQFISSKLKAYLKEPTVTVRNLNFRISVLGEVARPALFTVPNEQITLPEALGLAGDLTIYGRRDNVLVVREEGNQRIFARLDLTRRDAFKSPYYTLHSNDVVYVEPGKVRVTSVDRVYILAPIATGILSLIAIIATRR